MTSERINASSGQAIRIRGARAHNLKSISLDIPYYRLTSFCGLSGSGKSSLAFDVLYADGNRRYLESLAPLVRQRMEMLEKPDVDAIENIPAAVAVSSEDVGASSVATVGSVTEIEDYLRYLFARVGDPCCQSCGKVVRKFSPETAVDAVMKLPEGRKLMIAFAPSLQSFNAGLAEFKKEWLDKGFFRIISSNRVYDLRDDSFSALDFATAHLLYNSMEAYADELELDDWGLRGNKGENDHAENEEAKLVAHARVMMLNVNGDDSSLMRYLKKNDAVKRNPGAPPLFFVIDRVITGKADRKRLTESIETAFANGEARCWILAEGSCSYDDVDSENGKVVVQGKPRMIDGVEWSVFSFSRKLRCEECGVDFPDLEPSLFNFNSPKGACPICTGLGWWSAFDLEKVFPRRDLTIKEGAIAPWNGSSYRARLKEFLALADELDVRVDVPFYLLSSREVDAVLNGSAKLKYRGVNGFFWTMWEQKYKMHIRAYLNRWLTQCECPVCKGSRLRKEALAVKIAGKNIHDLASMPVADLLGVMDGWKFDKTRADIASTPLREIRSRLEYLNKVGLGYIAPERLAKTLSAGERRRVKLARALGSNLTDMLYVLDEPSAGLHPSDAENLREVVYDLRDRGNTVVVVDHNETMLRAADKIVELGPRAGSNGGEIVFEGTVEELEKDRNSLTGSYLSGRRTGGGVPARKKPQGWLKLTGASGHNLKNIDVQFPLGCLCAVTGVSGAGKSSLVCETLVPALYSLLGGDKTIADSGLPYKRLEGAEALDEAVYVDQSPIGKSPRSNPVTYLKIFDDVRALFAESPDAKSRGFNAGYFSFNVDGGRCDKCKGEGYLKTKMQYTSDVYSPCPICNGKRYQRAVLEVLYRGKNIYETLQLTAREAFEHFRGQPKIQQKLKRMMDVGLDYLPLGQPANTLSGGEAQRLKLCAYLSATRKTRTLFVFEEPTTGLHFADVVKLLDVFGSLVDMGHSIVMVEHNTFATRAADWIVDMGPGAADRGGQVVATGTPEEVARVAESITAKYLAKALKLKR